MATLALHSAATGLSAMSTSLDIIANNLANTNTDGFKASRANFQDLLYVERAQPGVENTIGQQRPTGLYVGLGVEISGTQVDFEQGAPNPTERPLDLMIDGNGFFPVEVEPDLGDGIGYTRAGNFTLNSDGELVLANSSGRRLIPSITIPDEATNVTIQEDGTVSVSLPGTVEPTDVGVIDIVTFVNPTGLKQVGQNIFLESQASGSPESGQPTQANRGRILQGFLEASNVDPVKELVRLIKTQHTFELNSQTIQAADEALKTLTNLRRF